ncbi:hypothetical protein ACXYMO_15360 [Arenibacterium sp. CAU 1754]
MLRKIQGLVVLAVIGYVIYGVVLGDRGEQTADLGQVLDRTEYALVNYQGFLSENEVTAPSDDQIKEFTLFYTAVLNADPKFYDKPLGLNVQQDASFLGYADTNGNGTQDNDEGKVFTVEIDEENNRLIATDVAGNSTGLRFSGTGFLAGALLGHFIGKQRAAGVSRGSFANRNVTSRSAYKAPSSARSRARSGGIRAGK